MKAHLGKMTPEQIRNTGIEALMESLGPTGTISFFQQFNLGRGDYTKERGKWLREKSVDEIFEKMKRMKKGK